MCMNVADLGTRDRNSSVLSRSEGAENLISWSRYRVIKKWLNWLMPIDIIDSECRVTSLLQL